MYSHIQIPKSILQLFRDESDPEKKVWSLNIETGEIRRTPSKRLGTFPDYYSAAGEKFWDQSLESPLGKLNKKVRSFCNGTSKTLTLTVEDQKLAKRYVKAAAIRSNLALEVMQESSLTAKVCTEQVNHDDLSFFGMKLEGNIDALLHDLTVTILINRTARHFVVPRNCFYFVSQKRNPNIITPISPQCALLFLPAETCKNEFAIANDSEVVEEMNICALKMEYAFRGEFVAADRQGELEFLQNYRQKNQKELLALKAKP